MGVGIQMFRMEYGQTGQNNNSIRFFLRLISSSESGNFVLCGLIFLGEVTE